MDELLIKGEEKPENEIQLIDQMEILKQEKPEKEEPILTHVSKKPLLKPQERDSIFILPQEKSPLQTEYIDEIKIKSELQPDNEIQIVDQMEVLKSYEKEVVKEIPPKKVYLMKKQTDSIKLLPKIQRVEKPKNIIQVIDRLVVPNSYERKLVIERPKNFIEKSEELEIIAEKIEEVEKDIEKLTDNKPKTPLQITKLDYITYKEKPKAKEETKPSEPKKYQPEYIDEVSIEGYPKVPNKIQNIDQMEILPIPRKNLIIQNIDRLVIQRDYDQYQYIMQSSWEETKGVQASGRPIHVLDKETGLERQDIDNFEILGSIIPQNLELEYINSIEIIERNNNNNVNNDMNNWDDLNIEYIEDLQISPDNNEVIGMRQYQNRNDNTGTGSNFRGSNYGNNNQGNQGNRSNFGNMNNISGNRHYEEDNVNNPNNNNYNNNSQRTYVIRGNYPNNNNYNNYGQMDDNIRGDMRGMIIRTIERQTVDHFEIIGEQGEIGGEYGRRREGILQIQRVNNINVIDNGINTNSNRDSNRINVNNNRININLPNNNNIINNSQNNPNYISSSENEMNNNINKSSFGPEKERDVMSSIRSKYQIELLEKEKQKNSWNKVNNIQQTSKLSIYQKRNSHSYFKENRSSWNEKNRQQGIVNLSVIDDNKKNLQKNEENINLNQENQDTNNNMGINFNDMNLKSSSRPTRKINSDYDVDGLDPNNNIDKNITGKKIENKEFEEDQKEEPKVEKKGSIDSKKSKKSGNISDKDNKKIVKKPSPKYEQQLNYQYNTNQNEPSLHGSKHIINQPLYKQPPSTSSKLFGKEPSLGDKTKKVSKISINLNDDNINDKYSPSSSMLKKTQQKPSGVTYMIDTKNKKDNVNNINLNNTDKRSSQYSVNFPKPKTYERDSNPQYMSQSQNVPTGKMKKKSKVKKFEYLREPNQSQNFQ